jgi:hypothetical protein
MMGTLGTLAGLFSWAAQGGAEASNVRRGLKAKKEMVFRGLLASFYCALFVPCCLLLSVAGLSVAAGVSVTPSHLSAHLSLHISLPLCSSSYGMYHCLSIY